MIGKMLGHHQIKEKLRQDGMSVLSIASMLPSQIRQGITEGNR